MVTSSINPRQRLLSDDEVRQRQFQTFTSYDVPYELWAGASSEEVEVVIRAVYRQVFGNVYIMESERLTVPESQLKSGELSVREFVRQAAKSKLYRSRFFDRCYPFRTIELNFKHLLGRAPDDYSEIVAHSDILNSQGFEADIDSYIDSNEYLDIFGENIVPYYRGYKSEPGRKMLGFTNMFQLVQGYSSSDKDLPSGNKALLTRSLITNTPFGKTKPTDIDALLASVFKPKSPEEAKYDEFAKARTEATLALHRKIQDQESQIAALEKQLAELRPFANIGAAQLNSSWQSSTPTPVGDSAFLEQKASDQAQRIAALQEQINDLRRYAAIGEARVNKWRNRFFVG